jgi:diguanylate cyclase (GGDEF)-like protein
LLPHTGSVVAASVPILADGKIAGYVVAITADRPDRLAVTPDLEQRLQGLAAQGSVAIRNARLIDEIHHQALHDTLTGLPNRALVLDRMDQMLRRGRRDKSSVAILFIDLDGFKDVNDTFGHEAGDRLLQEVSSRLLRTIRERDSVGRLGGDEFVVLVETFTSELSAEAVAERVLTALHEPFVINPKTSVTVTASIGVATGDRLSPSDLLRDADIALYEAKAAGKQQTMVFRPEMGAAAAQRLELEMDLQAAIAKQQFFLLYQPVVDLMTERITGVEALLRWLHPTRGIVMPDDFIPLLEQTGLIVPVGNWVLEEACRQAMSWERNGHKLKMSVNLSPRQLESDDLVEHVHNALWRTGLGAEQLVLEITETSVMNNVKAAATRLSRLKDLGIRVAIDDFGTGYSSLAYLPNLPIDILKIDRSFVSALGQPGEVGALVGMLVQLGKTLHLCTVAEGIEEETQLRQLQTEQCDGGQGFLFAQPLEPSAIESLLERGASVDNLMSPRR